MLDVKYRFSDEEYGQILDNFVIGCVDSVVLYQNKIILEKRQSNPIQGEWWIFGGRVQVGESLNDTARRGLARELGVEISSDRFVEIGSFNLIWPIRREPTVINGCHHLLIAHMVEINEREYDEINDYTSKNHMDVCWLDLNKLEDQKLLPEMNAIITKVKAYNASLITSVKIAKYAH
jgi:ADP-ribose pyrophosphatase YjhB (NUDIX family)